MPLRRDPLRVLPPDECKTPLLPCLDFHRYAHRRARRDPRSRNAGTRRVPSLDSNCNPWPWSPRASWGYRPCGISPLHRMSTWRSWPARVATTPLSFDRNNSLNALLTCRAPIFVRANSSQAREPLSCAARAASLSAHTAYDVCHATRLFVARRGCVGVGTGYASSVLSSRSPLLNHAARITSNPLLRKATPLIPTPC